MRPHPLRSRGAILLEIVISMAIFVGAAGFALAACRDALDALRRVEKEQEAIDLARSKMAELELGLVNLEDLNGARITSVGSIEDLDTMSPGPAPGTDGGWLVDVVTTRSEFTGLTLVEITVSDESVPVRFTLRQLVRLRDLEERGGDEEAGP